MVVKKNIDFIFKHLEDHLPQEHQPRVRGLKEQLEGNGALGENWNELMEKTGVWEVDPQERDNLCRGGVEYMLALNEGDSGKAQALLELPQNTLLRETLEELHKEEGVGGVGDDEDDDKTTNPQVGVSVAEYFGKSKGRVMFLIMLFIVITSVIRNEDVYLFTTSALAVPLAGELLNQGPRRADSRLYNTGMTLSFALASSMTHDTLKREEEMLKQARDAIAELFLKENIKSLRKIPEYFKEYNMRKTMSIVDKTFTGYLATSSTSLLSTTPYENPVLNAYMVELENEWTLKERGGKAVHITDTEKAKRVRSKAEDTLEIINKRILLLAGYRIGLSVFECFVIGYFFNKFMLHWKEEIKDEARFIKFLFLILTEPLIMTIGNVMVHNKPSEMLADFTGKKVEDKQFGITIEAAFLEEDIDDVSKFIFAFISLIRSYRKTIYLVIRLWRSESLGPQKTGEGRGDRMKRELDYEIMKAETKRDVMILSGILELIMGLVSLGQFDETVLNTTQSEMESIFIVLTAFKILLDGAKAAIFEYEILQARKTTRGVQERLENLQFVNSPFNLISLYKAVNQAVPNIGVSGMKLWLNALLLFLGVLDMEIFMTEWWWNLLFGGSPSKKPRQPRGLGPEVLQNPLPVDEGPRKGQLKLLDRGFGLNESTAAVEPTGGIDPGATYALN